MSEELSKLRVDDKLDTVLDQYLYRDALIVLGNFNAVAGTERTGLVVGGFFPSEEWVPSTSYSSLTPLSLLICASSSSFLGSQGSFFPTGISMSLAMADLAGWGGACNPYT